MSNKWFILHRETSEDLLKFLKSINLIHATIIQDIFGLHSEILDMRKTQSLGIREFSLVD